MRAIVTTEAGGPDVLRWDEVPDPVPGAGEVVLDVAATAVNRADLLQRRGFYPPPPGASEVLGLECSGTVAVAAGGLREGDQVCALLAGGGYAERVAVPAAQCLPVPAGIDLVTAAALPEAACTVWSNLVMVAGLRAGETLLVHGGGGGIGTFAVQLGAALGARVLVTAGSERKIRRAVELGADAGIDYTTEDFAARVAELTGGRGADVVLDIVGAKYLDANVRALATGGRLVVIGLQGGTRGEIDLGALLLKRATVAATTLRSRPVAEKGEIVRQVRAHVWPMLAAGMIRPVVDRVVPLEQAAEAHRVVEAGEHVGKVVLTTGPAGGPGTMPA